MSSHRLWYAGRDPYHCCFRLLRLLTAGVGEIEIEKFRILDMFLLFPPLLYKSSMPAHVRAIFREMKVEKPENIFINLPSTASIHQDLRLFQNSAMAHLAARRILDSEKMAAGLLRVNLGGLPADLLDRILNKNSLDNGIAEFLVGPYSSIPLKGTDGLIRRVGLPSTGVGN